MLSSSRMRLSWWIWACVSIPAVAGATPKWRLVHLNRPGGHYVPGPADDPSTNTTTIAAATSTLSPSNLSDADWGTLVGCMRDTYAPFALEITDVEPPPQVPYIESVVAGQLGELVHDADPDFSGIAPI